MKSWPTRYFKKVHSSAGWVGSRIGTKTEVPMRALAQCYAAPTFAHKFALK